MCDRAVLFAHKDSELLFYSSVSVSRFCSHLRRLYVASISIFCDRITGQVSHFNATLSPAAGRHHSGGGRERVLSQTIFAPLSGPLFRRPRLPYLSSGMNTQDVLVDPLKPTFAAARPIAVGVPENYPLKKQQRGSHACVRCKSRKQRCEGGSAQGECSNCRSVGAVCTFAPKPERKRRAARASVS